jgi:predicted nucleic acid-binding protein
VAALIDTNVLVYRVDPRDPRKQTVATETLRTRLSDDEDFATDRLYGTVRIVNPFA